MLTKQGDTFALVPLKVRYLQHGTEITQWALPNRQWWEDFAERWEHTTILGFIEITLAPEQMTRYEQVKNMPDGWIDQYTDYILEGKFPEPVEVDGITIDYAGCPLWELA
jgi:hypothetical protein